MRSADPAPMIRGMGERFRLVLDLNPSEAVTGTMRGSEDEERSFTGWLDLLAALEAACAAARAEHGEGEGRRPVGERQDSR